MEISDISPIKGCVDAKPAGKAAEMYDSPHQFEPLSLSTRQLEEVGPASERVVMAAVKLISAAHETTRASLRELVRQMNSFYSNRIEGQSTHPGNIERALQNDFSDKPAEARLQRIAIAHIDAEKELEGCVGHHHALTSTFLIDAHRAIYMRLKAEDRRSEEGEVIVPGQVRDREVTVGRHVAPNAGETANALRSMGANRRFVVAESGVRQVRQSLLRRAA